MLKTEVFNGSLQKSSEKNGNLMLKSSQKDLPTLFKNFPKFLEIFGNTWKTSENFENVIRGLWKLFMVFHSNTCGLKNFDLYFMLVLLLL